jgi:hypothetical protein
LGLRGDERLGAKALKPHARQSSTLRLLILREEAAEITLHDSGSEGICFDPVVLRELSYRASRQICLGGGSYPTGGRWRIKASEDVIDSLAKNRRFRAERIGHTNHISPQQDVGPIFLSVGGPFAVESFEPLGSREVSR